MRRYFKRTENLVVVVCMGFDRLYYWMGARGGFLGHVVGNWGSVSSFCKQ